MGEFAAKRPLWLCFRMTLEFPFLLEDQVWTLNKKEQDARTACYWVFCFSRSLFRGLVGGYLPIWGRRHTHLFILSRIAGTAISGVAGRGGLSRSSCRLLSRPRATPQSEGPRLRKCEHPSCRKLRLFQGFCLALSHPSPHFLSPSRFFCGNGVRQGFVVFCFVFFFPF